MTEKKEIGIISEDQMTGLIKLEEYEEMTKRNYIRATFKVDQIERAIKMIKMLGIKEIDIRLAEEKPMLITQEGKNSGIVIAPVYIRENKNETQNNK